MTAKTMGNVAASIDVVSADAGMWRLPADHSLDRYVEDRFGRVIAVGAPYEPPLIRLQSKLPSLVNWPDPLALLRRRVGRATKRLRPDEYDLLVTRSHFLSSHLVGLDLSKRERLPWVAHFSDPWVGGRRVPDGAVAGRVNRRLETAVVSKADRLIFTSEQAVAFTMRRYPAEFATKATHLPHSFDPSLYPVVGTGSGNKSNRKLVVRHVGHLRPERSPEPLFRALGRLRANDPQALSGVDIELVGEAAPEFLRTPAAQAVDDLVRVVGTVPYVESLRLMRKSDLLVVLEGEEEATVDLHGKIVDYLGAGRPIVGLVAPGPTRDLILRAGGWVGEPSDPTACAEALRAGLAAARTTRDELWGEGAVRHKHEAAVVGDRLTEIYRDVVDSPPTRPSIRKPRPGS